MDKLQTLAEAIKSIPINNEDSLKTLMDRFYDVMRKNNVMASSTYFDGDGHKHTTICSGEWIMCKSMFLQNIQSHLSIQDIICLPKDLV